MEFVVVSFRDPRGVNIDGAPRGQTGELLRVQAGTHNFDLGTPVDYMPPNVLTPVRGTTQADPLIITFTPLALARAAAPRKAAAHKKKKARKGPGTRSTRKSAARKALETKARAGSPRHPRKKPK